MSDEAESKFLNQEQLGEILQVPAQWCGRAARLGRIPSIHCGKYLRFRLPDVIAALERAEQDEREGGKN